jgi:outer membrane lipoprotein carrier protein
MWKVFPWFKTERKNSLPVKINRKGIAFMKKLLLIMLLCLAVKGFSPAVPATAETGTPEMRLEDILDRVETLYTASEFSADFIQVSTIKAMDISDSASGRLLVKYPGKMRWEYRQPETQIIVTDGEQLWLYRPEDRQVMVGEAATFFGEGKGAGFLSDIRRLRRDFDITLEDIRFSDYYNLRLVPLKQNWDLARIQLLVSKKTFQIFQVYTYNAYDDATRIEFANVQFDTPLPDSLFTFVIPDNVDVLKLDQ